MLLFFLGLLVGMLAGSFGAFLVIAKLTPPIFK